MNPILSRSSVALGALALLSGSLVFGTERQQTEVEIRPAAGQVSWLSGSGGNIGLMTGEDGLLMIDSQFQRTSEPVRKAILDEVGALPLWLVNTHHHGDHTDGNRVFGKGATVVAHENVRARMASSGFKAPALPTVSHVDGLSLHVNGEDVHLIHTPGAHTDGDSVVWFEGSNVVHMGDLYFQLGYPFIDVASGGNVLGVIEGIETVLARVPKDATFIPGHGQAGKRAGLEEYLSMLQTVTERVRAGRAAGDSPEDMVAAGVTKDFDGRWGGFDFVPPINFVKSVDASLAAAD